MSRRRMFQKEDIIRAAFAAWKGSRFNESRLQLVAERMGVSKTALYRCFRSKDELVRGMESLMLDEYLRTIEEMTVGLGSIETLSLPDIVEDYYSRVLRFFSVHPEYLYFLIHRFLNFKESRETYGKVLGTKEVPGLTGLIRKAAPGIPGEELSSAAWFLRDSVFFSVMGFFGREINEVCSVGETADTAHAADIEETIRRGIDVTLNGIIGGPVPDEARMRSLLKKAWIRPQEIPPPPPIFAAIEQVISEHGYENASLDKIAKAMKMDKSSMYYFFRNKEALFEETMLRENEQFLSVLEAKIGISEDPKERLWIYQVLVCSYAILRPELLTVLHWTLYQDFHAALPKEAARKSIAELERLIRESGWSFEDVRIYRPAQMLSYAYFLISRHLHRSWEKLGKDDPVEILEPLYRYITRGIGSLDAPVGISGKSTEQGD